MNNLKNPETEIKTHLTLLKSKFSGNPFTSENYVKPEFMFFVVDYYISIMKDIKNISKPDDSGKKVGDLL